MINYISRFSNNLERIIKKSRSMWSFILISTILLFLINLIIFFLIEFYEPNSSFKNSAGSGIIKNAIVRVLAQNKSGSGFFISGKYVLTAAHVVDDVGNQVQLTNENGLNISGTVILSGYQDWIRFAKDTNNFDLNNLTVNDWALVEVNGQTSADYLPIVSSSQVNQTDEVVVAGFPLGEPRLATSNDNVARIDNYYIATNQPADPGYSGGPLLLGKTLESGKVVGILILSDLLHKSIQTIANPIDNVMQKCKENGIDITQ